MTVCPRDVAPCGGLLNEPCWLAALLLLLVALGGVGEAHGQPDTTQVSPDDAGTSTLDPAPAPRLVFGRPVLDSIPARTPAVGVEHVLAQRPGSFLHDLGAVGWPHGWSVDGFAPHRSRVWIDGRPYTDPLLGRARYDLLPPSFLDPPHVGVDPGGTAVGVHAAWRTYERQRPITELRFRDDSNGLQAIEVGHSQKRRLDVGGTPGVLRITIGFGGRATNGAYADSDLRSERRAWGRLQYRRDDWGAELNNFYSAHRIGAQGGVVPPQEGNFDSVFSLPLAEESVRNRGATRRTFRNDLTARAWGPLLPGLDERTSLSLTWTSNTFDFETGDGQNAFGAPGDTTLTVALNGVHGTFRQALTAGPHALTVGARGSAWNVGESNVPGIEGTRWSTHAFARDSLRVGATGLVLDAGWHTTTDQQYPSASVRATHPLGASRLFASVELTGQQTDWIERGGFARFVTPLSDAPSSRTDRILKGTVGVQTRLGPVDLTLRGFAHQIRGGVDLFAEPNAPDAHTDSVVVRQLGSPLRRAGISVSLGWRRAAERGLYASGRATALTTLNEGDSPLHARLGRTLPTAHGQGRLGARFVLFEELTADVYVQGRGWSEMNGRWFHSPTGRLAVPPLDAPVPSAPSVRPGPSWTADLHTELSLRNATLFFTLENVQAGTDLQAGTFVVPVFPLPARQFRFGVFWPVFD